MVPVPPVNVPPEPLITVPFNENEMVLEPPFKVPFVRVQVPVNTWVKPEPAFSVPPVPLMVKPLALIFPVKVATPPVFVIEIFPVVVNPAMLWVAVPVIVTLDVLPTKVPSVMVMFPVKVCVLATPKLSVPPKPFSVKLAALTLPVNVAVPAVLVMFMLPVVVNPEML